MSASICIDRDVKTSDPGESLHEQLSQVSQTLWVSSALSFTRCSVPTFRPMCGAAYGARTPERVNSRNGYRHRDLGYPRRHHRCCDLQAANRDVPPRVAP